MPQWEDRYAAFPQRIRKYLYKAEERALELIKQRVWIRAGLERQIWKDTGVYPSLVGQTIKTLERFGLCWIGQHKGRTLRIVKRNRKQSVSVDFEGQHKRLDKHISNSAFHSDVLEVLINLSLYLIRNTTNLPVLIIPDDTISGQQFDTRFSYKGQNIGIEARNKTGDSSQSDTNDYIQKCYSCLVRPMMISTWMSNDAQHMLENVHGFFCNLCRIYTIGDYPEIGQDLSQNGFDKLVTILDFTRWGWNNATEAKKWLNEKENLKKHNEIVSKAEEIFLGKYEKRSLNHILQKVKGIFTYSLLSIHTEYLLHAERDLRRMGSKPYSEKQKQQLSFVPRTYLNMLFRSGTKQSLSQVTNAMSRAIYIKKQNRATRIRFIKGILNFLKDFKAIKKQNTSWVVDGANSPYIEANAIF